MYWHVERIWNECKLSKPYGNRIYVAGSIGTCNGIWKFRIEIDAICRMRLSFSTETVEKNDTGKMRIVNDVSKFGHRLPTGGVPPHTRIRNRKKNCGRGPDPATLPWEQWRMKKSL